MNLLWFHFVAWAIVQACQHISLCFCCVQVVRLCHEHGLYGALIYLFNQGLNDFRTPLEELLSVVQNTNSKDDTSSGYVIFWLAVVLWNNTIQYFIFSEHHSTYNMIRYFILSISCGLWIDHDLVNSEIPGKNVSSGKLLLNSVYSEYRCCSLSGYHFYLRIEQMNRDFSLLRVHTWM